MQSHWPHESLCAVLRASVLLEASELERFFSRQGNVSSAASPEHHQWRVDVMLMRQKQNRPCPCAQDGLEKGISHALASHLDAPSDPLPLQTREAVGPGLKMPLANTAARRKQRRF